MLTPIVCVIDPGCMSQTIQAPAAITGYLDIAWPSAAMGVAAGALGSNFESD